MNLQIRAIFSIVQYAQQLGVDPTFLCTAAGISLSEIQEGYIPSKSHLEKLWQEAVERSGQPTLGLHLGETYNLFSLSLVGQIIQHSKTIQEALVHACQYVSLLTDAFQLELVQQTDRFAIRVHPQPECVHQYPTAFRHSVDMALACADKEYQALTLQKVQPLQLSLQSFTQLAFSRELLEQKIITANYHLLQVLVQYANEQLAKQQTAGTLGQLVRKQIIERMSLNLPKIGDIAAGLNMSVRSLQRKLQAEGLQYQSLVDEIRKEFALRYLQEPRSIKEISFMLGYNEVSSFARSFKRWMGISPARYRQSLASTDKSLA